MGDEMNAVNRDLGLLTGRLDGVERTLGTVVEKLDKLQVTVAQGTGGVRVVHVLVMAGIALCAALVGVAGAHIH